jgi:hypothetical protein
LLQEEEQRESKRRMDIREKSTTERADGRRASEEQLSLMAKATNMYKLMSTAE